MGAIVVAVAALPQRYQPTFLPANESVRLYAAMAIVDHGQVGLDPVFDQLFPGWRRTGRAPVVDAAVQDGRYFLDKAPLVSWLAVPLLAAERALGAGLSPDALLWLLSLFLAALPAALAAALLPRWLPPGPWSRWVAVAMVLATPWGAYAGLLFGHSLAAALVGLGMVAALGRPTIDDGRGAFVGGLLLGMAVLTEYTCAAFAGVAGLALLADPRRRGRVLPLVLGGLGPAALLGVWNQANFGSPWTLGYALKAYAEHADIHAVGAWGMGAPSMERLIRLMVGPERGLLFLAPWLAAGGVGLVALVRRADVAVAWRVGLPLAAVAFPVLVSGFVDWQAGNAMGPRHLVPLVPLLAAAVAFVPGDERWWVLARPGVVGLALASFAVCFVGGAVFPWFPTTVRNPLFEVMVPVLLDGSGLGLGAAVAAVLGVVGVLWFARGLVPAASFPARLGLGVTAALLYLAVAVQPHTPGPEGEVTTSKEQALVHELRGDAVLATKIRMHLRR